MQARGVHGKMHLNRRPEGVKDSDRCEEEMRDARKRNGSKHSVMVTSEVISKQSWMLANEKEEKNHWCVSLS